MSADPTTCTEAPLSNMAQDRLSLGVPVLCAVLAWSSCVRSITLLPADRASVIEFLSFSTVIIFTSYLNNVNTSDRSSSTAFTFGFMVPLSSPDPFPCTLCPIGLGLLAVFWCDTFSSVARSLVGKSPLSIPFADIVGWVFILSLSVSCFLLGQFLAMCPGFPHE